MLPAIQAAKLAGDHGGGNPGDRCQVRVAQHPRRALVRRRVPALFGERAGEPGAHVQVPRVEIAFGAIGEPGAQVPVGIGEAPIRDRDGPEVRVRTNRMFVRIVGQGEVEALCQSLAAVNVVVAGHQRGADVVQRVDLGFAIADSTGQFDRPVSPN